MSLAMARNAGKGAQRFMPVAGNRGRNAFLQLHDPEALGLLLSAWLGRFQFFTTRFHGEPPFDLEKWSAK
jgi:hypothetical protein